MNINGLFLEPKFKDIDYYLEDGDLTKQTEFIKYISSRIEGDTEGRRIRNLIVWMNRNLPRIHGEKDKRKFRKSAEDIINEKRRTGCSDSALIFTTLCRAMGIPAMQVITFDKDWAEKADRGEDNNTTRGHFYSAVYIKDSDGVARWILVDPDQPAERIEDVRLTTLKVDDRNISRNRYAFAYARDFRDFSVDGRKIDSIENIRYMQIKSYRESDKLDMVNKDGMEM